jgi:hypothetical protein
VLASLVSENASHVLQATQVVQVGQTVSKPLHNGTTAIQSTAPFAQAPHSRYYARVTFRALNPKHVCIHPILRDSSPTNNLHRILFYLNFPSSCLPLCLSLLYRHSPKRLLEYALLFRSRGSSMVVQCSRTMVRMLRFGIFAPHTCYALHLVSPPH